MAQDRVAFVTGIQEDEFGHSVSVQYEGVPVDFGLTGKRLRGGGPNFYLNVVKGFRPEAEPKDYKTFGSQGIAVGVKIRCTVDPISESGVISNVRPF